MSEIDLDRLFQSRLAPRVAGLESRRGALIRTIVGGIVVAGLGVGSCSAVFSPPQAFHEASWWRFGPLLFGILSFACFGVAVSKFLVPGVMGFMKYRAVFKKEIVVEVIRALLPNARHFADRSLPKTLFDETRLFTPKASKLEGDDLIVGSVGDTPFEACEMDVSYSEGAGDDNTKVSVFRGLFLRVELDQDLSGRTVVEPRDADGGDRVGMEAVSLDADFDHAFNVWSTAPAAARQVLTPEVRKRLIEFEDETGDVHLAFAGSVATAALPFAKGLFEPGLGARFDAVALQKLARPLLTIPAVVQALGLEQRRRPASGAFHTQKVEIATLEAAVAAGNVGVVEMLDVMNKESEAAGPVGPPLHPFAQVDDTGAELSVSYPIGAGLVLVMLIAIGMTPVVAALGLNVLNPKLTAELVTQYVPTLRNAVSFAEDAPVVIFLISAFVYWMFVGTLMARPSRVVVSPQGVTIRKVLSLGAKLLPLEVIRSVQFSNLSVTFIRSDKGFFRSFVMASPNLQSNAEAQYVAQELKRALKRAGWRPAARPS